MNKILAVVTLVVSLVVSLNANSVLGPIPIYLNTEYRTESPVIGSIGSTIKLDRADIEATGANSFVELLATIPSVGFVYPQGNVAALFLRGTNSEHTLVLIDGVKVHDVSSTNGAAGNALEAIPLAQIERIEIVKGPYSSLYGSGAIGGIIQIFTKKGSGYNNIGVSIGSNNSKKINFSSSSKGDKGFINFNLSKYQTNGISARTDNTEKDETDNQSVGFKIAYNLSAKIDFIIDFLSAKANTEYDDCFSSNNCLSVKNLDKFSLKINQKIQDNWSASLNFSEINQDRDEAGYKPEYKTKDISLLNAINLSNALLNIGFSKVDDTTNSNFSTEKSLSSKDIFAQWQKNIANFDVNTGVRFINHSDFGKETVYNIGIAKQLNNGVKLTGSYGTAFRSPTIYEVNFALTTNLQAESSKNTEIGIEKQHNWGLSSIKFYKNNIKNLITYSDPNNDSNAPAYEQSDDFYFNEDKLNIKGIELGVSTKIKNYDINFSHNYVNSKLNNANTQSARRAKNTSDLSISKAYNKFDLRLQVVKKSSTIDNDGSNLSGYTLVNLSSNYNYNNKTKIFLNINNAFNKNYTLAKGYNQLGRTVNLGLNYKF